MTSPTPNPSPEVCNFAGLPTNAMVGSLDGGGWWARCNCWTMTYSGPDYDAAVAALNAHRALYPLPVDPTP